MSVHVSIHDVSPNWSREIEHALELCAEVGVKPALLVVPNFHGRAPLTEAPAFVDRLRALQDSGHELLLHGYYHRSGVAPLAGEDGSRPAPSGLRRFFAQRVVSASEAEFSDVSEAEARRRIDDGLRVMKAGGLAPSGFVPPAWSMPPWMLDVLASYDLAFTEDHLKVYDPRGRTSRTSVVLNYASRTPSRLFSSVAWVHIAKGAERVRHARVAIHPADLRVRFLRSETKSLLAWAKRRGFARSVRDLLSA